MIRRPPRLTQSRSSAASDVYKRQADMTGRGALLNTSFNLHGYPIVTTAAEAYEIFESTELEGLLLPNVLIMKKGKIICDATELKIYLKEDNHAEKLGKGWTIRYITDYAIPVSFYLRGEEYSAQIDNFIKCVLSRKQTDVNTFRQGLYTDKVIELIIADSKK